MKQLLLRQYRDIVNKAAQQLKGIRMPKEGWIRTTRESLGMSGAQLARRMGVTRARISQAEIKELSGGVTLRTMEAMAEAMGCRFVYAIVPEGTIEDIVARRAMQKAGKLLETSGVHMALEGQSLSNQQRQYELDRLKEELLKETPSDLWDES